MSGSSSSHGVTMWADALTTGNAGQGSVPLDLVEASGLELFFVGSFLSILLNH